MYTSLHLHTQLSVIYWLMDPTSKSMRTLSNPSALSAHCLVRSRYRKSPKLFVHFFIFLHFFSSQNAFRRTLSSCTQPVGHVGSPSRGGYRCKIQAKNPRSRDRRDPDLSKRFTQYYYIKRGCTMYASDIENNGTKRARDLIKNN